MRPEPTANRMTNRDAPPIPPMSPFSPLSAFYASGTVPMPTPTVIAASDIPDPYRSLLVNQGDMTATLERFYGSRVNLKILGSSQVRDEYRRQVVLRDDRERVVEFGAICIHFEVLTPTVLAQVLRGGRPVGGLLQENSVKHSSSPQCFFTMDSDGTINAALGLAQASRLYGRCNTLWDGAGRAIADIVEILPPALS
jgi:chorismate-pyruvate lyase